MSSAPRAAISEHRSAEIRAAVGPRSGVVGFISWSRLAQALRDTQSIGSNETIECFLVEDDGLCIYYGNRPDIKAGG